MARLGLRLTPHGHLVPETGADAPMLDDKSAERLAEAFKYGGGPGLVQLGAGEVGRALPPLFHWWRSFAARYVESICLKTPAPGPDDPEPDLPESIAVPTEAECATLVLTAPLMPGAEYLSADVLRQLWGELDAAFRGRFAAAGTDLQSFLKAMNPAWNLVGRVHFNLAENRKDPDWPFAFMATYTTQLSDQAKARHVPLGQALRDYAGSDNRDKLLSLLMPVQRAAERCDWLKAMVEAGEIYHPLRWSPAEAARFLSSSEALEQAGVIVRMPATWQSGRPARPKVSATVGTAPPGGAGLDAILDFDMEVTLDGDPLTAGEIKSLLAGTDSLVLLRGRWVEIDRDRLGATMEQFEAAQALAARDGLTFAQAMRLLAGAAVSEDDPVSDGADWAQVRAGPWLAETLQALRAPQGNGLAADPGPDLKGTLRPYQQAGVAWMRLLTGLGLGACLADDMGLGKTIQVLALLLVQRRAQRNGRESDAGTAAPPPPSRPSLLVAPASLLANWAGEIERFAPDLSVSIVHPSAMPADALKALTPDHFAGTDLAITSYGTLLRQKALTETEWQLVILDEAQAIKNPGTKQTKAVKALKARARIALTGTPIENRLGDLWSLFDFLNPGLLGPAKAFTKYTRSLSDRTEDPYGPLRDLVRPYILRRMKTDKVVISDLPEKTEVTAWCGLSRRQAALYAQTVRELQDALADSEGIERRGLVLAMLMRLKQICNHPSHWLGDGAWAEADSGKFGRLREIAESIAARQEKMLVFTQFKEVAAPLAAFLGGVFGRPGLVLHGGTAVRKRKELVQQFQEDEDVPFFILSLKAGGSGLTLTAASHVVHFDRWWNPAVENQATDRAFRIGQKRNVLVHKFVCQGTVEEKIDTLIESKKALSQDLLSGGEEINVTEMSDAELVNLVSLDLQATMKD